MKRILLITLKLTTALILTSAASESPPTSYTNYTVGGAAGWFFDGKTNTPAANYSAWALNNTFNLGDRLIFNTTSGQVVIQTYNATTFKSCSQENASDSDTSIYYSGLIGIIDIQLTEEGENYYFDGGNDGIPCSKGLAFMINVKKGLGLPPDLRQPPPPPYTEPPEPYMESINITIPATPPASPASRTRRFYSHLLVASLVSFISFI